MRLRQNSIHTIQIYALLSNIRKLLIKIQIHPEKKNKRYTVFHGKQTKKKRRSINQNYVGNLIESLRVGSLPLCACLKGLRAAKNCQKKIAEQSQQINKNIKE